tara:strand:- start:576 stop:2189 length:1614 start_codon:yes stop_codon:yes gene_type:complete
MLSSDLVQKASDVLERKLEQITVLQDQIVILDNEKTDYDYAISNLDTVLVTEAKKVNDSFQEVEEAYQGRLDSGCRSDLVWQVVLFSDDGEGTDEYDLRCIKLNTDGYADKVGVGTTTITVITPGGGGQLQSFPVNTAADIGFGVDNTGTSTILGSTGLTTTINGSKFGFDIRHKYALQVYNEPYARDIGDTFKSSFIGTIAQSGSIITVMEPLGAGLSESFGLGNIVIPDDPAIFSGTAKITGIATASVDLSVVPNLTGINTNSQLVNILTVDQTSNKDIKLNDNTFTSFKVIGDPDEFANEGRTKFILPNRPLTDRFGDVMSPAQNPGGLTQNGFDTDPFVPQEVGILSTSTVGTGVSIKLDVTGQPEVPQSWDPNEAGFIVEFNDRGDPLAGPVEEPKVGGGKMYYPVGFASQPMRAGGGSAAVEGDQLSSITDGDFAQLYQTLSDCSTGVANTVTEKLGISSTAETAFLADEGDNNILIETTNALRAQRNDEYSIRIWGMRQALTKLNEEVDVQIRLKDVLGISTALNIIDNK